MTYVRLEQRLDRTNLGALHTAPTQNFGVSQDQHTPLTVPQFIWQHVTDCHATRTIVRTGKCGHEVLLQKINSSLSQIPAFHKTQSFIILFTTSSHFSLSGARLIHSAYSHL